MGAIKRLQTHADKRLSIELIETEIVLSEAEENERIKRLSKDILNAVRFLESRGSSNPGVDEGGTVIEEISQDLEKRLPK